MSGRARALRRRAANLPRAGELRGFVAVLRSDTRASALRGVVDGLVVTIKLRRTGVRPLLVPDAQGGAVTDAARARAVSDAVDAGLAMLPVASTCLRRSLTLMRELHRLALAATLHIGVRDVDGTIEAHAWVQVGPSVVNDEPDLVATYVELASGRLDDIAALLR